MDPLTPNRLPGRTPARIAASGLALAAAALLLGGSVACSPVTRGNIEVDWTFAGKDCSQANVANIRVALGGELLTPDTFACQANGTVRTGALLDTGDRFLVGDYALTVTGLDANGAAIFQAQQTIRVAHRGVNAFALDAGPVTPAAGGPGAATVRWTFSGGSCAAAGNPTVYVWLDGVALGDASGNAALPCAQAGVDGIAISPLEAGNHTLDVEADLGGRPAFGLKGVSFSLAAGESVEVAPDLPRVQASGGAAELHWTFAGLSCAEAQVDKVRLSVDGQDQGELPCTAAGVDGASFGPLPAGTHRFAIQGIRQTLLVHQSADVGGQIVAPYSTLVAIDAAAVSPGAGGATLSWTFPAGGPSCSGPGAGPSVQWTLIDPTGKVSSSGTSGCGAGATGIAYCAPGSAGCGPGQSLSVGLWEIRATAQSGAQSWSADTVFAVPNAASASWDVPLK